jgi:hypothetical protein
MKPFLLIFAVLFQMSLNGEIELVTLTWDPTPCRESCQTNLRKRLAAAAGVASAEVYGDVGRAEITWKPNSPFSFVPLNWALRFVGLRERTVRVKVSGTISGGGKNFSLVSRGDHTNFVLLNRVAPVEPSHYTNEYSRTNRDLSQELIDKLEEGKKKKLIAVIEGLLFEPYRSPPNPNQLIVDQISFEEAKKQDSSKPVLKKKNARLESR